ncbi:hypothetical protein D3C76_1216960 [compost metagenome]
MGENSLNIPRISTGVGLAAAEVLDSVNAHVLASLSQRDSTDRIRETAISGGLPQVFQPAPIFEPHAVAVHVHLGFGVQR